MKQKDIRVVVKNKEWQLLRGKLAGTWTKTPHKNLTQLRVYLGNPWNASPDKLRRVHNILGSLRGSKNKEITSMRNYIRRVRDSRGLR